MQHVYTGCWWVFRVIKTIPIKKQCFHGKTWHNFCVSYSHLCQVEVRDRDDRTSGRCLGADAPAGDEGRSQKPALGGCWGRLGDENNPPDFGGSFSKAPGEITLSSVTPSLALHSPGDEVVPGGKQRMGKKNIFPLPSSSSPGSPQSTSVMKLGLLGTCLGHGR